MNRALVWLGLALASVSVVAWVLGFFNPLDPVPMPTPLAKQLGGPSAQVDAGRPRAAPLGTSPVEPLAAASTRADRFKLVGVVSPGPTSHSNPAAGGGIALIAIDGKPPQAFRVGATVDGDTVVREVSASGAVLGPRAGGAAVALQVSSAPAPPSAIAAPLPTPYPPVESLPPESMQGVSKYLPMPRPAELPTEVPATAPDKVSDGRWTR